MSAGTLTLTNNSAAVSGSETAFTTDLTVGDFIAATVGGITYTLPVKSVESATSLTLVSKYSGPTQSGVAWSSIPRAAQNQITAALVAQTTEALRGLNYDKANWQAVFSASGDITVILPDGSTFFGPSWNKIAELLNSIDPDAIQALANQINADAEQVAVDRLDVDAKAAQASNDAATSSTAATNATAANTAAQSAKTDAINAKIAAEAARDAAQEANPTLQLTKAANLSDVADVATARSNIGAAASGINSDITRITGLTTPLSLGQGGVGATTQSGARNNLGVPAGTTSQMVSAWVAFNGANGAMSGGYGVSSVTRNSAGSYTVNFSTPLTTNYAAIALATAGSGQGVATGLCGMISAGLNSASFVTFSTTLSLVDSTAVYFAVVGGRS